MTPSGIEPATFWLVAQCIINKVSGKKKPASLQAINIINLFSFDTAACVPFPVLLSEKGVVLWVLLCMYVSPKT